MQLQILVSRCNILGNFLNRESNLPVEATLRTNSFSGGTLLLYEAVTPENRFPGFIFGLLPGWWLCK